MSLAALQTPDQIQLQDPELHHPMVKVDRAAPAFTFQPSSSLFVKINSCRASPLFISSATCISILQMCSCSSSSPRKI
ncbi:hypothetical protein AV530_006379 [Patagioenas fasciata monilis]|uniref:Uncharacterized protein n=1 Tax=Patagioenas fasciata monilis TaxID=372326 RepID=A0A1V4KGH3_PATFA|nr:hypothetical protein AV530_006379 [Patagioenas fasciata monilis]